MDDQILIEREELLKGFIGEIGFNDDPRINRGKKHSLSEIFFLVLCSQICGCDSFREYVFYGKLKLNFLRQFLPYKDGVPSRSTIARVLALFDPKVLEGMFAEWARSITRKDDLNQNESEQSVVAIDGKRHCGVRSESMHLVNAYDTKTGLCIGQEKVADKSNEITAIPELLDTLMIAGQIVSIDAMGCQKKIASKIRSRGADYFLALKGNQGDLLDDVKTYFDDQKALKKCDTFVATDKGHGRIEVRSCYATSDINWMSGKSEWQGLKSIVMIESKRIIGNKITTERRYFLTSLDPIAKKLLSTSRAHWGIENSLNWVLDVIFREDDRIIWNKNIAQSEALIRRMALNLIKQYREVHPANRRTEKVAIKTLRKSLIGDDIGMAATLRGQF